MTSRYLRIAIAAPMLAGGIGLAAAPLAFAVSESVHAQAATQATLSPTDLRDSVTDTAGVLSGEEKAKIGEAITQLRQTKQLNAFVVYLDSFGGVDPAEWVRDAITDKGPNTAVIAISPAEGKYNVNAGSQWSSSDVDKMSNAAFNQLTQKNYGAAGLDAISAVNGSSDGDGAAIVAGGVGAAALAGGGFWLYGRNKNKKADQKQLASARELSPGDTDSLGRLPTPTLEKLAQDALVHTDESIRVGKEELQIATEEFGAERVRPFTSAMNQATSALQRAFNIHHRLYDAIPETEPEKRAMLIDIISSCGQAEQALGEKSEEFQSMRNVLMKADQEIDAIFQRTVDLRARLEPARATLGDLRSRYSEQILESISSNVDIAEESIDEAEKQLEEARGLAAQPAGRQGALVDVLRGAQHTVEVADNNLDAIEHADTNIQTSRANLPALIQEIKDELQDIEQLKAERDRGARIDVSALDSISSRARQELDAIGNRDETDPLALFMELTQLDTDIDAEIDKARGVASDQRRQLQLLDQQLQVAAAQLQSAQDLIQSRGRIIGSQARALLAESGRQFAEAQNRRIKDTRSAIEYAREATNTARRAAQAAESDIDYYRRRQTSQSMNNMASAIIWGSLLSGGGGYGGGFGGGGGGGFSGGGGGGFAGGMGGRGGSF